MRAKPTLTTKILIALALAAPLAAIPIHRAFSTVSNQATKTVTALGNGATVNYTIGFTFQDNAHVHVYLQDESTTPYTRTEVLQGAGASKFTITGGNPGTTVHMGTAPTDTQRLVILRQTPLTQTVNYVETSAFPATSHEAAMDKQVLIVQELESAADAKLGLAPESTATTPTLPDPSADSFLVYNHGGTDLTLAPTAGTSISSGDILKYNGSAWALFDVDSEFSTLQSALDAHIADTSNPHSVTAAQVGNSTAQWNANKIKDVLVDDASKADGYVLSFDSGSGHLIYSPAPLSPSLTDAHIFVGNASNSAADVALSGDASLNNTGALTVSHSATADAFSASPSGCAAGNLANSIDTGGNLSCVQVSDTEIASAAAIARSKLADGTADHVLINDGTGVMSSEAQLAKSRGGTGADNSSVTFPSSGTIVTEDATEALTNKDIDGGTASNTSRITLPKASTSTLSGLTRKQGTIAYDTTQNRVVYDDGSSLNAVGSGSGSGGGDQRLTNGDFESGTTGWTASTGTFTTQNSTLFAGTASGSWVLSAATGSLSQDVTPAQPLKGVNLEASCWVNTTASTFQVCSRQGGTEIQCTPVSSDGNWHKYSLNMSGPSSGSVGVDVSTTASTTGTAYVDQCYVGSATNLAQVSQAKLLGTVTITGCSAPWSVSGTSFASFSAGTGCSYAVTGLAQAPATNIPGIKFASIPPGEVKIEAEGTFSSGTQNFLSYYQFSDSLINARESSVIGSAAGGALYSSNVNQSLSYSSTQSSVTLQLTAKVDSGGTAKVFGSNANPLVIRVYLYPSQSQTVLGPDATAASWSGYLAGSWGSVTASYGDVTGTGISITARANTNFGTVSAMAGTLPGVTFTPPRIGKYLVCFTTSGYVSAASTAGIQLVDGANTVLNGGTTSYYPGSGVFQPFSQCGILTVSSIASTSIKLKAKVSGGATFTFGSSDNIEWQITQLDAGQPAPLLTGSQTCTGDNCRTDGAVISAVSSGAGCTISRQTGKMVASVSGNAADDCSMTLSASEFSGAPMCSCTTINGGGSSGCGFYADPTASLIRVVGNSTSHVYHVLCTGPR